MPDPVYTRLDSINDLESLFSRIAGSVGGGRWGTDTGGSTNSGSTGPSTNSGGTYVFSETSSSTFAALSAQSTLTVRDDTDEWAAWINDGRTLDLRACIQGSSGFNNVLAGFDIEGSEDGGTTWERIELLQFWPYAFSRAVGDIVTDSGGNDHEVVQVGGWVDFSIEVETRFDAVRMRVRAFSGNTYQHDVALWQVSLTPGDEPEEPETPANPARLLWRGLTLLWRGSELHWRAS